MVQSSPPMDRQGVGLIVLYSAAKVKEVACSFTKRIEKTPGGNEMGVVVFHITRTHPRLSVM